MGISLSCLDSTSPVLLETLLLRTVSDEELTEFAVQPLSNIMSMESSCKPHLLRVSAERLSGSTSTISAETDCTPKLQSSSPASPLPRLPYQSPQQARIFSSNVRDSCVNLIQVLSPCASTPQSRAASRCVSPLAFGKGKKESLANE